MIPTYVEQLLNSKKGEFIEREVDLLMGHDGTASLIVERFEKEQQNIWNKDKVFIVFDHFAPPATVERAEIQNKLLNFVRKYQIPFALYEGIAHQLLLEHSEVLPGKLIIGADSHTTTSGALGALATGVGATDFYKVLVSGRIWLRVPETIKVEITGDVLPYLQGKDIALEIIRILGSDGAIYKALEFHDLTNNGISIENRSTICNMAVDMGAKFGIFYPDHLTYEYISIKNKKVDNLSLNIEKPTNDSYERIITINLDSLSPLSLTPEGEVVKVLELEGKDITQIFIGSCTSGRLEDLSALASILKDHRSHPYVKLIVIPASNTIFKQALDAGFIETCIDGGAVISNSSCGPCCNIDKGLIGEGEICLSTSNRNYAGRMGSLKSSVYLVSGLTAAASCISGKITDPRRYFS